MSEHLNPVRYPERECGVCCGSGYIENDSNTCEFCGGTGMEFTELGLAVWELAVEASHRQRAISRSRRKR